MPMLDATQALSLREASHDPFENVKEQIEVSIFALLAGRVPSIFQSLFQSEVEKASFEGLLKRLIVEVIRVSNSNYYFLFIFFIVFHASYV